jgi:hypothetical protein
MREYRGGLRPERVRRILEAYERNMDANVAAEYAGVCLSAAQRYYNKWRALPTEAFDGLLGDGATVADVRKAVARRVELPLSDSIVREKLDFMVLLGYCEKFEKDGEVKYKAKKPEH